MRLIKSLQLSKPSICAATVYLSNSDLMKLSNLFAKKLIFVEGLSEQILIPEFVKLMNKMATKMAPKKEEEAPAAPTTKVCEFCKSEIAIEATRCPHCTSVLEEK